MARYTDVTVDDFDARLHRPGSPARQGACTLHGTTCPEPAVVSMLATDVSGRRVRVSACGRGVREYGLDRLQRSA